MVVIEELTLSEGGSVARLSMGTRGAGSMAIGTTGDAILPGGRTVEGYINVAEKCIVAGCDILDLDEGGKWAYTDEVLFARGASAN